MTEPEHYLNSIPSHVRHVFVCGWTEEVVFTRPMSHHVLANVERVTLPNYYLAESVKGNAIVIPKTTVTAEVVHTLPQSWTTSRFVGGDRSTGALYVEACRPLRAASGLCLTAAEGYTAWDVIQAFVDSPSKVFLMVEFQRRRRPSASSSTAMEVKTQNNEQKGSLSPSEGESVVSLPECAITLKTWFPVCHDLLRNFPAVVASEKEESLSATRRNVEPPPSPSSSSSASQVRSMILTGKWHHRDVPAPLVRGIPPHLLTQRVQHFFGYGTLRSDDTSGASWTVPFNQGLTSELALLPDLGLFLFHYPVVLVPAVEQEGIENRGVVGRLVWEHETVQRTAQRLAEEHQRERRERLMQPYHSNHNTKTKKTKTHPTDDCDDDDEEEEEEGGRFDWATWQCSWSSEFANKVSLADRIEGCPHNYLRGVVEIEKRSAASESSSSSASVLAFLYYKDSRQSDAYGAASVSSNGVLRALEDANWKKHWIKSGNFLRRGAAFEGLPP